MEEKIFTESPYVIPSTAKEIKDFIREIPGSPGVYKFLDKLKRPIYIGKAKSLNKDLLHISEAPLDLKRLIVS